MCKILLRCGADPNAQNWRVRRVVCIDYMAGTPYEYLLYVYMLYGGYAASGGSQQGHVLCPCSTAKSHTQQAVTITFRNASTRHSRALACVVVVVVRERVRANACVSVCLCVRARAHAEYTLARTHALSRRRKGQTALHTSATHSIQALCPYKLCIFSSIQPEYFLVRTSCLTV
jgi:hypothetical protein